MSITRKLAILIVFGVPAIVGGGIMFWLFDGYHPVVVYEVILALLAGSLVTG